MKIYTFKGGASFTEQDIISLFYHKKRWMTTFYCMKPPFREDIGLLFSALDKFGNLTNEKI